MASVQHQPTGGCNEEVCTPDLGYHSSESAQNGNLLFCEYLQNTIKKARISGLFFSPFRVAILRRQTNNARKMNIQPLIVEVNDKLKTSAFRFLETVGYGIDYKNNQYYFLDEIGSRIIKSLTEYGQVDIGSIAAEYDAPIELILEDTVAFLQGFLVCESDEKSLAIQSQDEAFLSYFSDNRIPLSATIEITEACNEHCVHCYRPEPSKEAWSVELFERTCIELKDIGTLQIDFTGGEPFLKKGFVEYLKIADKHGFILSILTNATLVTDDAIDVLKNAKVRNVYVSIYSSNPDIHDAITRLPGSFYQTVATIKKLTANNIPVFLNAPIMAINKDSPQGITALADSLGLEVKFAYKITESYNKKISTKKINVYSKDELSKQINGVGAQLAIAYITKA
ncbi:MAG: hypothetical protein CVU16_15765 [Betaproteobacteria bacterium HGW-Betaproteobacteria-10]|nr:MAG: hypothetical protein CVU16_15765 [Betaproteobacteria bacterium HGW-Betaproteobacteria-10]